MYIVNPSSEVLFDMSASVAPFDLEALFRSQYGHVARIIEQFAKANGEVTSTLPSNRHRRLRE
jgi:hypothetical protein